MFSRLFTKHPASVGESYLQHLTHSASFGLTMLAGAFACFIHALLPMLFERTGSGIIARLHDRMIVNRSRIKRAKGCEPAE
ncbi:MAG: DUF6356 family protein [Sphingomonas sp.]|uniref:DUF6356 family protein n=1 Tax=Sphingomonas sp. TaxID=28214 RepID=UPI00260E936F|nr:DUF6356 family protein [Sphingomonas sp.]MDK2770528.1 DUF6356 family protein [Sphingomonas sp.]